MQTAAMGIVCQIIRLAEGDSNITFCCKNESSKYSSNISKTQTHPLLK